MEAGRHVFTVDPLLRDATRGHGHITSMAAGKDVIVLGTSKGWLVRHDYSSRDSFDLDLSAGRTGDQPVHRIFVDPGGSHCIVTVIGSGGAETYYTHAKWVKPRILNKLKGVVVNAVAWNKQQITEASTREIILGTDNGQLYEISVDEKDKKEKYMKLLFELTELPEAFMGLQMETATIHNGTRYYVMAVTPTRLYSFTGIGFLDTVFAGYSERAVHFMELPGDIPNRQVIQIFIVSSLLSSELHFFIKQRRAVHFAWLSGAGIYHGDLNFGAQHSSSSGDENFVENKALLDYSKLSESGDAVKPRSLAVSQFHFLLLIGEKVKVVNRISQQIVEELKFDHGPESFSKGIIGLCTDPTPGFEMGLLDESSGLFYAYDENSVFQVSVQDEGRDMWQVYLNMKDYVAALAHCRNPLQRDQVYLVQADAAFSSKDFYRAASFYAKMSYILSFEEISLKFIDIGEQDALRTYLLRKLDNLAKDDKCQITMISTWATELYLDKLVQSKGISITSLDRHGRCLDEEAIHQPTRQFDTELYHISITFDFDIPYPSRTSWIFVNTINRMLLEDDKENAGDATSGGSTEYQSTIREFRAFLSDCKDVLDEETTMRLLESHGRIDELVYFASLKEHHEIAVHHYIQQGEARKALEVLQKVNVPVDLQYKFAPDLIMLDAYETVEAWMATNLNPRMLIPAMMRYSSEPHAKNETHEAIKYLEFCVHQLHNEDPAVHNLLLSLYAKQADDSALLRFLQCKFGKGRTSGPECFYDPKFALRLCLKEKRMRACVYIYSMMGMHEEAVALALQILFINNFNIHVKTEYGEIGAFVCWLVHQVDPELAMAEADKVEDDEDMRKKLWLMVAKHVIKQEKGAKRENIRKAIAFLKETDGLLKIEDILPFFPDFALIDDFKEAICSSLEDYNKQIEQLKQEMNDATRGADNIRNDISALAQRYAVIDREEECGAEYILDLQKQLSLLGNRSAKESSNAMNGESITSMTPAEKLRSQLDDAIAGECPFCGELMIREITLPFVSLEEAEEAGSWEIRPMIAVARWNPNLARIRHHWSGTQDVHKFFLTMLLPSQVRDHLLLRILDVRRDCICLLSLSETKNMPIKEMVIV
ncbi:hypothetical protein QJS04_geneDACA003179 [Acorus gramineus]|uniref:Pep3/Vps18 beta-propeller domain-containing protein n=1 Tax=Acorus gramineus TaxID=55184 RepID=A0AAV9BSS2_ACOGR|nr:hypothetical protein QJS04_geneDACA003179 [Acorus gramineus]